MANTNSSGSGSKKSGGNKGIKMSNGKVVGSGSRKKK